MPEGDTVHRAARRLDEALSGQVLTGSDFRIPSLATRDLSGRTVLRTRARGKHLLTRFDGEVTLHSHLKMDGSWVVHPLGSRWRQPAFQARAVLRTATTEAVGFEVQLDLVPTGDEDLLVGHLGPDLLGPDWDAEVALTNLRRDPEARIGDALLDQRNLAGIGNVYRVELCFTAGLDPATPVALVPDLPRLVRRAKLMLEANKERTNRVTTGDRRRPLWVYGQRTCPRCRGPIRREDQGPVGQERVTYWCPACQPPRT